jgi:pimeloyl-ACP methyl ester carboxylesterase
VQRGGFIGHSLGGGIVQRLALSRPELVERLVLVSAVSAAEPPMRTVPAIMSPLVRPLQGILAAAPGLMRRMNQNTVYDPAFITDEVWEGYARPYRLPGSAAALRKMLRDLRHDEQEDVGAIHVPALLIWGEHDAVVKPEVGRRLHEAIAGSRLEIVPDAGHLPLEEQPDLCNRLILDFLADLAARPAAATSTGAPAASDAGQRP